LAREILDPIIDRLELAAIDRDASFGEEAHRAAEHNKLANLGLELLRKAEEDRQA
jgi:hypothetical protein